VTPLVEHAQRDTRPRRDLGDELGAFQARGPDFKVQ
jgi:hypothetical protein